jgi:hypothetical protein
MHLHHDLLVQKWLKKGDVDFRFQVCHIFWRDIGDRQKKFEATNFQSLYCYS